MARSVVSVDLSGGASTAENDELTTGPTSTAKAMAGGFAPDHRSAAGRAAAASLLEAYTRWQRRQDAAERTQKAVARPEDAEEVALRKSRKRLRRHIQEGVSPARATVLAHEHYRRKGGRSAVGVWSRKVEAG
jgi:hypothetical protein